MSEHSKQFIDNYQNNMEAQVVDNSTEPQIFNIVSSFVSNPQPKDTSLDSKIDGNILPVIDIVDTLIHSITRRHIPDYPEAQVAIQSILALIISERSEAAFDEVDILKEMQRITRKTTISYLTKDGESYINGRCKELTQQSNGGK